MAALEWDKVGERFYENGVDHCALYPQDSTGTYPKGVAWNGITGITESPDGAEANDIYADNIKYGSLRSTETLSLTVEAYTYPDEFAVLDGTASPVKGVYLGQQKRASFGLVYRTQIGNDTSTEEDDGYKLHLVYGCTASPSERAYETINDSPDAISFSWSIDTTPVAVKGFKPLSNITISSLDVDKEKLAALEKILFGSADAESGTPRLPLPDEVLTTLGYTASA